MCGIAGIFSRAPIELVPALHDLMIMLQHRGHEAAGGIFFDGEKWTHERRLAETKNSVSHFFGKFGRENLTGIMAGGHTRYSTAGGSSKIDNVQPFFVKTKYGHLGVAHNGNLVRAQQLKETVLRDCIFSSDSDTEVILQLIARSKKETLNEAIIESLEIVGGSFSILFFSKDGIVAARDGFGFRPLSLAEFEHGYMLSSETCSFDTLKQKMRVNLLREIEPGEVIEINKFGITTIGRLKSERKAQCIFELIYFARPDTNMFGWNVDEFREKTGFEHAKRYPRKVDCVIAVPDSSNYFADGRAIGLQVRNERALVRSHSSGRTFIDPNQGSRGKNVRIKLNPIPRRIKDKNIDVCDDSIVRGTTSRKVINMIKGCNPRSISLSVGAPAVIFPCIYGIDTPSKGDLIAAQISEDKIANHLGVDFLNYLPLDLLQEIGGKDFCYACFSGEYPLK